MAAASMAENPAGGSPEMRPLNEALKGEICYYCANRAANSEIHDTATAILNGEAAKKVENELAESGGENALSQRN